MCKCRNIVKKVSHIGRIINDIFIYSLLILSILQVLANWLYIFVLCQLVSPMYGWDRRGRDFMVVGFTATYAINVHHHWCCDFEPRSEQSAQHYVIKFVSDLLQVGYFLYTTLCDKVCQLQVGYFLRVLRFPLPIKLNATIWLKYW